MKIPSDQPDTIPTEEAATVYSLKKRAVSGVFLLGIRRIVFQLILTGGNIILARLLFPAVFGSFAIIQGIINIFLVFSSLSMGMALVQKKKEPKEFEIRTAFTATFIMTVFIVGLIYVFSPAIASLYRFQLGEKGILCLRLLAASIILLSVREISSALLERKMNYSKIIVAEIFEVIILQCVTILLALKGFGVFSFIWGVLFSRIGGSIIFWLFSPWPMGFSLSWPAIRDLSRFGWNAQLLNIINMLEGALVPLFVGIVAGSSAVGLMNFAGGLAAFPLIISEVISRVVFPLGARFQEDTQRLTKIIEKSIRLIGLGTYPAVALVAALAKPITYLIYTDRWEAGIPAVWIFSLQSVFNLFSLIPNQALLSLGEAKTVRNINLFWMFLQWTLAVPLVIRFGFIGMALAGAIAAMTFFIPIIKLKKKVTIRLWCNIWPYLLFSLISGGVVFAVNRYYPARSAAAIMSYMLTGGIVYFGLTWLGKRKVMVDDLVTLKNTITTARRFK